jgi:hypothetical protein
MAKLAAEEEAKLAAEAQAKLAAEEEAKLAAEEEAKLAAEAKAKLAAEEKAALAAEEKAKLAAEEKAKHEAEEAKAKHEADEAKAKQEADEAKAKHEAVKKARKEDEEVEQRRQQQVDQEAREEEIAEQQVHAAAYAELEEATKWAHGDYSNDTVKEEKKGDGPFVVLKGPEGAGEYTVAASALRVIEDVDAAKARAGEAVAMAMQATAAAVAPTGFLQSAYYGPKPKAGDLERDVEIMKQEHLTEIEKMQQDHGHQLAAMLDYHQKNKLPLPKPEHTWSNKREILIRELDKGGVLTKLRDSSVLKNRLQQTVDHEDFEALVIDAVPAHSGALEILAKGVADLRTQIQHISAEDSAEAKYNAAEVLEVKIRVALWVQRYARELWVQQEVCAAEPVAAIDAKDKMQALHEKLKKWGKIFVPTKAVCTIHTQTAVDRPPKELAGLPEPFECHFELWEVQSKLGHMCKTGLRTVRDKFTSAQTKHSPQFDLFIVYRDRHCVSANDPALSHHHISTHPAARTLAVDSALN